MSDFERVKAAMSMVAKHKLQSRELRDKDIAMLAETALKAVWLIEEENRLKGLAPQPKHGE